MNNNMDSRAYDKFFDVYNELMSIVDPTSIDRSLPCKLLLKWIACGIEQKVPSNDDPFSLYENIHPFMIVNNSLDGRKMKDMVTLRELKDSGKRETFVGQRLLLLDGKYKGLNCVLKKWKGRTGHRTAMVILESTKETVDISLYKHVVVVK